MVFFGSIINDIRTVQLVSLMITVLLAVMTGAYLNQKLSYGNLCQAYCSEVYDTKSFFSDGSKCVCHFVPANASRNFNDVSLSNLSDSSIGNFSFNFTRPYP